MKEYDPVEEAMKKKCDERDKAQQDKVDAEMKIFNERSQYKNLKKYVNPWGAVFLGIFMACLNGCQSPCIGIVFSKFMTYLGVPFEFLWAFNDEKRLPTKAENIARGKEILEERVNMYCLIITTISCIILMSYFVANKMWNLLGTNLTVQLRKDLYDAILEKDIGWFDFPDNGVSVITSAMA